MSQDKLKAKISNWSKVDKNAYALLLDLAKERLDEVLLESESMTEKSIKIVAGLAAFAGFFSGYLLNNPIFLKQHIDILAWTGGAIAVNIGLFASLILPKYVKNRGLPPLVALVDKFDSPDDEEKQVEMLYYNVLNNFQENIEYMITKNGSRAKLYKSALILFLILVVVIPLVAAYVIFHS